MEQVYTFITIALGVITSCTTSYVSDTFEAAKSYQIIAYSEQKTVGARARVECCAECARNKVCITVLFRDKNPFVCHLLLLSGADTERNVLGSTKNEVAFVRLNITTPASVMEPEKSCNDRGFTPTSEGCFMILNHPFTGFEAFGICEHFAESITLAGLETNQKRAVVADLMNEALHDGCCAWVGAKDVGINDFLWKWSGIQVSADIWVLGHPSNGNGDCAFYNRTADLLVNAPCNNNDHEYPFVCEENQ